MRVGTVVPAEGVPDSEALRQAALRASWARDRHVGRRRIWKRWMVWFALRLGLPALAVASVLLFGRLLAEHLQARETIRVPDAAPPLLPASSAAVNAAGLDPPPLNTPALRLDLIPSPDSASQTPSSTPGDSRP